MRPLHISTPARLPRLSSIVLGLALTLSCGSRFAAAQGVLEPPGQPAPTQKSLQEVWDRIDATRQKATNARADTTALQGKVTDLQTAQDTAAATADSVETGQADERFLLGLFFQHSLPWRDSEVDTLPPAGNNLDIAVSPEGELLIAYRDNASLRLKLAKFDGAAWQFEIIDSPSTAALPSLAIGPDGHPAVAYYNTSGAGSLHIARFDGNRWNTETIDPDATPGNRKSCSLAFAPNGLPVIAYYDDTSKFLTLARSLGTAWQLETIEKITDAGGTDAAPSLAFAPDGQPAIAYYLHTTGDLRFARFDGFIWNLETVDDLGDTGFFSSLAFGPDGQPAIAYAKPFGAVGYARLAAGTWVKTSVDPTGNSGAYVDLTFASDGTPLIAYRAEAFDAIRLARFDGVQWTWTAAVVFGASGASAMTLDQAGLPVIAYRALAGDGLRLVRRYLPEP